jgi:Arc/MetJ family transcription regulator
MYMKRRTTIEIDEELLVRARRALDAPTTRATVEEALRRVVEAQESAAQTRATSQRRYLHELSARVDLEVLGSEEMGGHIDP